MIDGLVSVIIPTYNRYETFCRAVQSVKDQTYKNVEIIIINDGSDDPRYSQIKSHDNITVIHLPINLKKKYNVDYDQALVRNMGLNMAKGQWIAFLDDDDWWRHDKLELQLRALAEHPTHRMSSSMRVDFNINDNKPADVYYMSCYGEPLIDDNKWDLSLESNTKANHVANSTVVFAAELLQKVGLMENVVAEDWAYWKKIMQHTNCIVFKEPLMFYGVGNKKNYEFPKDAAI